MFIPLTTMYSLILTCISTLPSSFDFGALALSGLTARVTSTSVTLSDRQSEHLFYCLSKRMPPAAKKAKSSHTLPPATPFDVKGKGKDNLETTRKDKDAMDVESDSESLSGEENENDDEGSNEDDDESEGGESMDTEDEIELAQQPTKSKQTMSTSHL